MKKILLLTYTSIIIAASFSGCKKSTEKPLDPIKSPFAGTVKASASLDNDFLFSISETDPQGVLVTRKDTLVRGAYRIEFTPHLNNSVHVEIDWSLTLKHTPTFSVSYDAKQLTNFFSGQNTANFNSISFIAN